MKIKPASPARPAKAWLTDEYRAYLASPAWAGVRMAALMRAGYRCSVCGLSRGLAVHHKTYEHLGHEAWGDLRVLCDTCHLAADRRRRGVR